jgi:hypothetical protein
MPTTDDFRDANWEPSDEQHAALMEDFRRMVLWRKAMAARGVKVLGLRMTPREETQAMRKWWGEEGCAVTRNEAAR